MNTDRFRECLDILNLTQRGLARMLRRSEGTVRQWAGGRVLVPEDVGAWLEERALHAAKTSPPPPPPARRMK